MQNKKNKNRNVPKLFSATLLIKVAPPKKKKKMKKKKRQQRCRLSDTAGISPKDKWNQTDCNSSEIPIDSPTEFSMESIFVLSSNRKTYYNSSWSMQFFKFIPWKTALWRRFSEVGNSLKKNKIYIEGFPYSSKPCVFGSILNYLKSAWTESFTFFKLSSRFSI